MAVELAVAYLPILPETSKIAPGVKQALGASENEADRSGKRAGRRFGKRFGEGMDGLRGPALAVVAGIGGIVASSVNLEKKFSQTMNVTAATLGAPQKEMAKLNKLALDLGASTSFSANEAADAMQELAKGGLSAATIQAGALEGTLQLAAAGGTTLASAAEIASNALNTFKLSGDQMNVVSAALAGGANASTASVESLGHALSQVGPGAVNAGLNLNDTVGALAAFDNAGIKGSDAGTSLKTMLSRLVPQTAKAATAMKDANLDFTDANGNFVSLTEVAQQLKDGLGGLSEAQRTTALNTIFGSDASRAASVLMTEGAKGLGVYIKATRDQGAAEDAARARMSGTAGALERLSGAWETLRLKVGIGVAPVVSSLAGGLTKLADVVGNNLDIVGPLAVGLGVMAGVILAIAAATWVWNVALAANPIGLLIVGIAGLVAGLAFFFTKTKAGQAIVTTVWGASRPPWALSSAGGQVRPGPH
ncbi:phage tail tape measure protein [Promicromonospora kroppenstedtii]|uniref:phage tail tape measure protein n=1 Tax=Promicromonospora kroppenstedtii TaxID=440482 RepID=UPI0004B5CF2C|nr:phage tail tape measure protein [Promicromonospora kroppenstedtii]